jgi:putative membrane protein
VINYSFLPELNAALNAVAAVFLLAGFIFIKRRSIRAHRASMIAAFGASVAFLISYIAYHLHAGDVRFLGRGLIRPVYFTILISHIILAVAVVPLAVITIMRALRGRFASHRAIARWTWPIWIYVSVTGVIVYLLVYRIYPHSALH